MSRDKATLKAMVKKASQVLKDHPTLKVAEAMRVAKFTLDESKDSTLQMHLSHLQNPHINNCLPLPVTYTNKCIKPYLYIHYV